MLALSSNMKNLQNNEQPASSGLISQPFLAYLIGRLDRRILRLSCPAERWRGADCAMRRAYLRGFGRDRSQVLPLP